jgi:hypothetical protein
MNSGNTSRDPTRFTEITDAWEVPSEHEGQYKVMMSRADGLIQPFHVWPGDTIIKRRFDPKKALVQIHPGTERPCIQTYDDDIIRVDCTDDNGNQVSQQRSFDSEAPPLGFRPGRPTFYTLCSQSGGDLPLAFLLPGQGLSVRHVRYWNLERWPGDKTKRPYVMATFGPCAKAGYVKCSGDITRDDSTTMQSNAVFRDCTGSRVSYADGR